MTTTTKQFDNTLTGIAKRPYIASIVSVVGAVVALASLIFATIQLSRMNNAIHEKRQELAHLEARTADAVRLLDTLQLTSSRQSTVLSQVTEHITADEPVPPELLAQARQSIATGEAVKAQVQRELPAVGIVIANEAQRPVARQLSDALRHKGFRVKYVLSVGTRGRSPGNTEIRHFLAPDQPRQAEDILQVVNSEFQIADAKLAYTVDRTTPPNEFEIWLSPSATSNDAIE